MLKVAVGHSDDVDASDAIAIVIAQCRSQLGELAPQAGNRSLPRPETPSRSSRAG